jgi:integrase/recombinase XerD
LCLIKDIIRHYKLRREPSVKSEDLAVIGVGTKALSEATDFPALVAEAGNNARFAWEEFLYGSISNLHTRRAYSKALQNLFNEADSAGLSIQQITPKFIRAHLERMLTSTPTKKLRLSAIRHFFDLAVTRHVLPLNPALSVRGEKYSASEGRTPEISVAQARKLLGACKEDTTIGLRDKVIISTFIYTAARVGAVARLTVGDFVSNGEQWHLKFREKGGKAREIPVRHDLEQLIKQYLDAAALTGVKKETPLFLSTTGKTQLLTTLAMCPDDIRRMLKRRLKEAGLPTVFSPHSFRVCTLTDLLKQDVPREDVQYLAGHADARTTNLYDRRNKRITRNIVERISV